MSKYKSDNACRKCGATDAKTVYHAVYHETGHRTTADIMKRICSRCGFSWFEDPLDKDHTLPRPPEQTA